MNISHSFAEYVGKIGVTRDNFIEFCSLGYVVDARAGGYVLGRSHEDGNVYFMQCSEDGKFIFRLCLEGGEYIINAESYKAFKTRVEEINTYYVKEDFRHIDSVRMSEKTRILNTRSEPFDKFLFFGADQFVVNKYATARYYDELEDINHQNNPSNKFYFDVKMLG